MLDATDLPPADKPRLSRLAGKKVLLQGKFDYGEKDRLSAAAQLQGATLSDALDASLDYLVLPDLTAGQSHQKKANSLIAKGAAIQVLDIPAFEKLVETTDDQYLHLLRTGGADAADTFNKVLRTINYRQYNLANSGTIAFKIFADENFASADLATFQAHLFSFQKCSFASACVTQTSFGRLEDCDFSKANGKSPSFQDVPRCRFHEVHLDAPRFDGDFSGADFSSARLEEAVFSSRTRYLSSGRRSAPPAITAVLFTKATLRRANFTSLHLQFPDFSYADLAKCTFADCSLPDANFKNALAHAANFVGCKLPRADFTGADLANANFANADLSHARFDGANLQDANLRGATLTGVDFSNARNYNPAPAVGTVGPHVTELTTVAHKAKRLQFSFRVLTGAPGDTEGEETSIDTAALTWGYALRLPFSIANAASRSPVTTFSDTLLLMANLLGSRKIRFDTLDVTSTKSPTSGKELRELILNALSEITAQPLPPADELAAATKAWRDREKEASAAHREELQKQREAQKQQEEARKQQAEQVIKKEVGKVSDTATFLKALALRIEQPKIKKATSMLKAEGFKLFNDITTDHLAGVVKSQTDPDLVYACRITKEGKYACCTQNLNVCGGLRGSVCKHLLVLIIGLVQAGELDPETIDAWVAASNATKPELDKELMGEIFIKYKGAEAGEVDWRPTETMPEDYYAL